ncbi:unnamed protein product [Closterium sp. Yama58-4]|nr:unnamed protein product [Closterium sp. Yama58-4]
METYAAGPARVSKLSVPGMQEAMPDREGKCVRRVLRNENGSSGGGGGHEGGGAGPAGTGRIRQAARRRVHHRRVGADAAGLRIGSGAVQSGAGGQLHRQPRCPCCCCRAAGRAGGGGGAAQLCGRAQQQGHRGRLAHPALPFFLLIDCLLSFPPLATAIFNRVRTRDNVASVLRAVYSNPDAVDGELVQLICAPAEHPGALHVFTAVLTGPPGPRPEHLLPQIEAPLLLLWGEQDPFTPLDGPVGRFFSQLPQHRPLTTMLTLPLCGHCPHDDQPVAVQQALLPWLAQLASTK